MEYLLKYRHNLLYYQWLVYIMPFFHIKLHEPYELFNQSYSKK